MERLNEGHLKWAALGATVVALEVIGKESLTHWAHVGMEHKYARWVLPPLIGLTAMHLMDKDHNILPESIDLFRLLAKGIDWIKDE